jgi:2',3'-cyclic-nucleotide 2'-phosphodiesterase (5'-nucleotidase family)
LPAKTVGLPEVTVARCSAVWIFAVLLAQAGFLPGRQVPITLLHTADLQGQLFPTADSADAPRLGGILRAARYVNGVREAERNVLLVDSGDSLGGAAESDAPCSLDVPLMVAAMNALAYDAVVPGDRDLGRYADRLSGVKAPVLAANLVGLEAARSHMVLQVDGVRVVVIGLTWPGFQLRYLASSLRVGSSVEALQEIMAAIKVLEPDVICLVAHQGVGDEAGSELRDVMRRFPEIDVVIGGHTGQIVPEAVFGDTLYAQAGAGGRRVGRIDLVWDTVARQLIKREARLMSISARMVEDPLLIKALEPALSEARMQIRLPVGEVTGRFQRRISGGSSGKERLIGRAMAEMNEADVVWWDKDAVRIQEGVVTEQVLAQAIPDDEGLMRVLLTTADMREIFEELETVGLPMIWGLKWEKDSDDVYRFTDAEGRGLNGRRRYAVVLPESLAASADGRYPSLRRVVHQPVARLTPCAYRLRSTLRAFMEKHTPINSADE